MATSNDIKKGMCMEYSNDIYKVIEFLHVKPGKGAAFVKTKLKEYGVEENRMTTEGKGGRERIASLQDRENWWKNRRVEFLLHK